MFTRIDQRVAVLIDTQNMYHSAKHIHGARLAFGKVVDAVAMGRPVVRAIAYVAKSKTGEEQSFFEALSEMGIELKIKDVQEFASGEKKADWDVGMAVDAVKLAKKVDVVILMTGDGDFVPLVEYLKNQGVIVEVAAFSESTNAQLRVVADRFFDISSEGRQYLMGKKIARSSYSSHTSPEESHDEEPSPTAEDLSKEPKPKRGRPPTPSSRRVKVTF